MKRNYPKTEEELRERFDAGEDVESLGFDLSKGRVVQPAVKRVNVDFPEPVLARIDREAQIRGITRQALIKSWIYDRLNPKSEFKIRRFHRLRRLTEG